MNLQSPTSLLNSIQFMRDRLRSDKATLQDLKHDFSSVHTKPRPPPITIIPQESFFDDPSKRLEDPPSKAPSHEEQGSRSRQKLIEVRKEHQKEMSRLKKEHQEEIHRLVEGLAREKQELEDSWQTKYEDQARYIAILEEQVNSCSPIKSEREKVSHQEYDAVVQQLLQENTRLHHQLQQARDQSEQWRKQARQLWAEVEAKSRLRNSSKGLIFNSQRTLKAQSVGNDENQEDYNKSSKWSDISIQNDEVPLKTIKEFPLGVGQCGKGAMVPMKLR